MRLHVTSDGDAARTRVVLIDEDQRRLDITTQVRGVTWHLDDSGRPARAILVLDGVMSAEVQGLLGLATQEAVALEEARAAMMEFPG